MGRKRIKDKDLPQRWTRRRGKIYYQVPPGQQHKFEGKTLYPLGENLANAFYKWAQITELDYKSATMNGIFDRYAHEVIPTKKIATQIGNIECLKPLRLVFGNMRPEDIKSAHLYQYRDKRSKTAPVQANRELSVLSHVFTKCIEWGAIERHPMVNKGVVRNTEKPRDRLPTLEEIDLFLKNCAPWMKEYVVLKLLVGGRKSAILAIKESDIMDDGVLIHESKVGRSRIFSWTPELRQTIDKIMELRPAFRSEYIFCTRNGDPYYQGGRKPSAFNSAWGRAMRKALEEEPELKRFTEHDIRSTVASYATAERAKELLGHIDPRITERVYRLGIDYVLPAQYSSART